MQQDQGVHIIGAGPAGLTAGYLLAQAGRGCRIIERDSQVGGLARTVWYKGCGFDVGGHRFFTKIQPVQEIWKELLGDDFIRVPRLSRIYYRNRYFHYPLKPLNALTGLGVVNSLSILGSYAWRQMRPLPAEDFFEQYVINRFGDRLYEIFFRSYTEKVWGIPCTEIRADWAAQRIKNLCLKEAVRSAFFGDSNSKVKSLIEEFDYPRRGPGMLWERMADAITGAGNTVVTDREVTGIEHEGSRVVAITHTDADGGDPVRENVDYVFSTMPLRTLLRRMSPAPPKEVLDAAGRLQYRDFITVNLIVNAAELFPDNWIYVHSPEVRVGRIQNFRNWSRDLSPDPGRIGVGMEYFCFEGDDLWSMSDDALVDLATNELARLGLARADQVVDGFALRVKKAYPMYDEHFAENLAVIRQWLSRFENLQQLGRNGLHKYNNQDHSMLTAMCGVANLVDSAGHDLWALNSDDEYQETARA